MARSSRAETRGRGDGEDGDTLVELLISIVIIALTVTALLGALETSITNSAEHRQLSADDTLAKSFAEQAKYAIELRTSPGPLFRNCVGAPPGDLTYSNSNLGWSLPSGYTGYDASIVRVVYWDGSGFNSSYSQAQCNANKTGIQLLVIKVTSPTGVAIQLSEAVRDPICGTTYATPPSPC